MKKMFIVACLSMLATTPAFAEHAADHHADAKPAKELTPQQQKMKDCNVEAKAKALKGADRKTFMKGCLSADGGAPVAAEPAPAMTDKKAAQREKMKSCNADAKAKALKGDERKTFMKDCLSAG